MDKEMKRKTQVWFAAFCTLVALSGCNRAELERARVMEMEARASAEEARAVAQASLHKAEASAADQIAALQNEVRQLRAKLRAQFQGQSIFDGTTFEGWEGNMELFRIEEGAVVAGNLNAEIPRNEFLCSTKEYEDFELRLKVKAIGDGVNAGIQFRSQRIPNHHEVSGYQADVGKGWWGKLYDESRRNKTLVGKDNSKLVKQDDWNDYAIRCEGNRIQLFLNGEMTVDYVEEESEIATKGVIGLQIHGGPPSEAWYKDVEIQEL